MFRNYLVIALRNIIRHKLYSFINIAGLAVGLACVILITLFIRDELSYDKWITGSDKLYRVEVTYHVPNRSDLILAQTSMPLTAAMRDQIPEVRSATRLIQEHMTMGAGDRQFSETVAAVDPNFLQVVQLPLVTGDPRTALSQRDSIVISQSIARKYFGDTDPIGKVLTTGRGRCQDTVCANSTVSLRVVGVMRDLPHNTQIDADILMPADSLADRSDPQQIQNWLTNQNWYGYVTLAPGADPAQIIAKLKPILDRSIDISRFVNVKIPGSRIMEPRLVPFVDAHLSTDRYGGMRPPGSWTIVYGTGVIGLLILLVACFNFMNLATARATMRAREISLRKCVGATRTQLIIQFLGESVVIALIGLLLALALAEILLPAYGSFLGVPLTLHYLADWPLMLAFIGVAIFAGLLGGFYPALVISGFRPAAVLRSNQSANPGSGTLRTGLVVLQFAVSIGLGIAAMVVYRQIDFARHLDLGFRHDNIVIMGSGAGRLSPEGVDSFIRALARGPGILGVTRSSSIAFNGDNSTLPTQKPGDPQFLSPTSYAVTPDYFSLYGVKILAGRVLSDHRTDDEFHNQNEENYTALNEGHNVMINAALARELGYAPSDIVGKTFIFGRSHMQVVGVAADMLVDGARSPVMPTVFYYRPNGAQSLSVRIQAGHTQEAMAYIDRVSRSFLHNAAPMRHLLNDSYEKLYQADRKQGQMFAAFVAIAIVIACMGLFGLAAFTAGRRTKEIGIRKVFGARIRDVVWLLLWQFSIPVLIANLIAWPIAWYYLHSWLQGFTYRIALSPFYFLGAGLVALLIAWATVFSHARRVAGANPIHALRYE